MISYICTLPVDSDWEEFLEAARLDGGSYIAMDARSLSKAHIASSRTCWAEHASPQERIIHQEEHHPIYIALARKQTWQAFLNRQKGSELFTPIL